MTRVLDGLEAEYGTSQELVDFLMKRLSFARDSIISTMGTGRNSRGGTTTVFENRRDLEAHYRKVLSPDSVSLYDPRAVIAIEHISPAEQKKIRDAAKNNSQNIQAINSASINTTRYGYQLNMKLGNEFAKHMYSFGFVRFKTTGGRRVMRALVQIGKEPYLAAAVHQPKVISQLQAMMNLITHDNTIHNLWHQNGGVAKNDLVRFQEKMARTPWSNQPVPNNEIDSAVGHYLILKHLFKQHPRIKKTVLRQSASFERNVLELASKYENQLYADAVARLGNNASAASKRAARQQARQQASSVRDYFLTAYFNKAMTYAMAPEDYKEVRKVFDKYPFLYKQRKFAEQVALRARTGKLAYPAESHAQLLKEYRANLQRFSEGR